MKFEKTASVGWVSKQQPASIPTACVAAPLTLPAGGTNFKTEVQGVCGTHAHVFWCSNHCFKLLDNLKRRLKTFRIKAV